ncbi:MAG: MBL fold metallo-hydrolase [Lachnospiraceae bacterium]|nr:MBL fold metallo-hydrolase [Lachnospiraceae bacterium]
MEKIAEHLYQFSIYIPPMDFTIHQYLMDTDPAILFATGTVQQAQAVLPEIKKILGERELKYIFVSHVESDESGGIAVFQKEYPEMIVLCSDLAARELPGYGFTCHITPVREEITIEDGELDLCFINYPAEVHLQNGVLCMDKKSGIMYSADLFLRYGNGVGQLIQSNWETEVSAIDGDRMPGLQNQKKLKESLASWEPKIVAVGHGFCMEV